MVLYSGILTQFASTHQSGLPFGVLLLLQVGDGRLPVFRLSETDRPVDAEIFQEHPRHLPE
jgi:hypothetical protein